MGYYSGVDSDGSLMITSVEENTAISKIPCQLRVRANWIIV